jgi:hypothetical protein
MKIFNLIITTQKKIEKDREEAFVRGLEEGLDCENDGLIWILDMIKGAAKKIMNGDCDQKQVAKFIYDMARGNGSEESHEVH